MKEKSDRILGRKIMYKIIALKMNERKIKISFFCNDVITNITNYLEENDLKSFEHACKSFYDGMEWKWLNQNRFPHNLIESTKVKDQLKNLPAELKRLLNYLSKTNEEILTRLQDRTYHKKIFFILTKYYEHIKDIYTCHRLSYTINLFHGNQTPGKYTPQFPRLFESICSQTVPLDPLKLRDFINQIEPNWKGGLNPGLLKGILVERPYAYWTLITSHFYRLRSGCKDAGTSDLARSMILNKRFDIEKQLFQNAPFRLYFDTFTKINDFDSCIVLIHIIKDLMPEGQDCFAYYGLNKILRQGCKFYDEEGFSRILEKLRDTIARTGGISLIEPYDNGAFRPGKGFNQNVANLFLLLGKLFATSNKIRDIRIAINIVQSLRRSKESAKAKEVTETIAKSTKFLEYQKRWIMTRLEQINHESIEPNENLYKFLI